MMLVFAGVFNNCLVALIVWRTRRMQNPTNISTNTVSTLFRRLDTNVKPTFAKLRQNNVDITLSTLSCNLFSTKFRRRNDVVCPLGEVVFLLASGSFFVIGKLSRMGDFTVSQSLMFLRVNGFVSVMIIVSYYVASVNLALLAFERFNALCNPMKIRRRLSKRSAKLSILMMWLAATIFLFPLIVSFTFSNGGYKDMENLIYYDCILSATISAISGCTITYYCYGRIIYGIHIAKSIFNSACSVTASEDIRAKRNIVKMLLSITMTFILTKFPAAAYSALILVVRPSTYCHETFVITLAHLSAFLNPIIYFVFNSNYRQEARRMLKSCSQNNFSSQ